MAAIERLIETKELKTNWWFDLVASKRVRPHYYYNEIVDSFTLLFVDPNTPKIVHYIDDYVALLYHPDSKEIIGIRVESFVRGFLPLYSVLEEAWRLRGKDIELHNFGELAFEVKKFEPVVTNELSKITRGLAEKRGLALPVPA